jgi:hypothetical protein
MVVQHLVNWSLLTSTVPASQKTANVKPLLKKTSLDCSELKNYRPVSNLTFMSKLVERAVASQLMEHCDRNNITSKFQSAYKSGHSTETALTRVQNDLLRAVDSEGGAVLVLLDLSAAFDTLDHTLLLHSFEHRIGIRGSALAWMRSYLLGRMQRVCIGRTMSDPVPLLYGVPQGSVLGPLLFCLYTQPLADVIASHGMSFHLYADDTQVYLPINPRTSSAPAITTVQQCVSDIQQWMNENFLKLNGDKTELLVLSAPTLSAHRISNITICGSEIHASTAVRNLGVQLDPELSLHQNISAICKSAYHRLAEIRKIRKNISDDMARTIVQAKVMSLVDYCNSLLYGLPAKEIERLQRVQNCAARVITGASRYDHITPILKDLHWLPVKHRISYKINIMTFKALHNTGPTYITDLIEWHRPARSLRSAGQSLLVEPRFRLQRFGGRTFAVGAPKLWNALPIDLRNENDFSHFKSKLKTFYFMLSFN